MLTLFVFTMHDAGKLRREGLRTRDAHLLEALNRHPSVGRLLVLDRPATRPERLVGRRLSSGSVDSIPGELGLEKVEYVHAESDAVYKPIRLRSTWWLHAYEGASLSPRSTQSILEALSASTAAISFVPTAFPVWRGQIPTIFDLLDDWLIHPQLGGKDRNAFEVAYRASFAAADWVTANSEATRGLAERFGRRASLLTNGVDHEWIQRLATEHAASWRRKLERLPRPWLLYAGKMQERVDVDLLAELAAGSEGTLLLAGPILDRGWMRGILRTRRVVWLRDVHYSRLPGLIAVADVGLIPHRVGRDFGGDPLKANEYAAGGLRFVSTEVTGATRIGKKGVVARSSSEFVAAVRGLGRDTRTLEERLSAVRARNDESWDWKADELVRLVDGRTAEVTAAR